MMLGENNLIGIIHFENFAKIVLPMTLVKDSANRKKILNTAIPRNSNGRKSNIWNGKLSFRKFKRGNLYLLYS